jgi:hypothetical protein
MLSLLTCIGQSRRLQDFLARLGTPDQQGQRGLAVTPKTTATILRDCSGHHVGWLSFDPVR